MIRRASSKAWRTSSNRARMLVNGFGHRRGQPNRPRSLARGVREAIEVQIEAGKRPAEVGPSRSHASMERGGVRHLLLDDVRVEVANGDIETGARSDSAAEHRILGPVPQGYELVVPLEVGERQRRGPAQRFAHGSQSPVNLGKERAEVCRRRGLVKASDPNVDGMDLAAAEPRDDGVSGFLDAQAALDDVGMILWPWPARRDSRGNRARGA